ncbi:hypothetical protein KM043_012937 [Ampulex compressa]|nr:hypothetical protein KM043_012937 [Ampulex compressa]
MEENAQEKEDKEKNDNMSLDTMPLLKELFIIHGKVGEGTFSSVFLATLKSSNESKKFALKHLIPTRHPEKIERELQCMQQIGGKDYVVGLELCLRSLGTVVFVMPYLRHDKFSEYVQDMTVPETKEYMRALLTALRRVHKFNIIHRDIKPSNFLYDRRNKRYLLVDFGLAQEYVIETKSSLSKKLQDTRTQSLKRKRSDENNVNTSLNSARKIKEDKCFCFGKPKICSICTAKPEQTAPRAGTPGFRAPEVLLKYSFQTPAIDIWASGVMMLCILSGTQPFFHSPDDCTALAEITTIFGSNKIQQCAQKLGKKIIFSDNIPGIDIVFLCQKLQKRNRGLLNNSENMPNDKVPLEIQYPKEAYDLLTKLLDLDSKTRITAEEALNHPFLKL